jgi:hypothetical protein
VHPVALAVYLILTSIAASAGELPAAAYHHCYHDPYVATSTAALLRGREQITNGVIKDLSLTVIPSGTGIPLLKGKGRLRYRLYRHDGAAPLIFVVPGLGA